MRISTLLAGTALMALTTPAFAQQDENPTPATIPEGQAADTEDDEGRIEEIVVTAQKRDESIQEVPVAVSALSADQLDNPIVQDIRDIAGRVPSLVVDPVGAGPSAAAISIRGISFEDIEKSFDPAVGVVVDGVFIGTNTGQLLDSFDLAGLEVLRGPQGTLFGRNTIGGVINVARTKPTGEFGVKGRASYANYETLTGRLLVNTPSIGGILALKGFVYYDDTEGFYRNVTKNRREGMYETLSYGVTALITPVEGVEAVVTYEHMRERGETVSTSLSETGRDVICLQIPIPGVGLVRPFAPAAQCDRSQLEFRGGYTTFSAAPNAVINDTDAITGNINIELGDFLLTSVTGYRTNEEDVGQDFDGTSVDFFATNRVQDYDQFSQEIRIAGDVTEWLNLLVGGYYFDSSYQLVQSTRFGPGLLGPMPVVLRQDVDHNAESYAAFTDAQIKLGDRITIGLGGRYTEDKKDIFSTFGVPAALAGNGQCLQANQTLCSGRASFDKFTYRANATFEIDDTKRVYVSYSRGFRSGGFNGRAASPTSLGPYEPETVDAYEIGLKADWLDRRLRTNFAIYQTDYNNKQEEVVQPSPPGAANPQETVVQNAATARIRGFEAEITARPVDVLTFSASLTYTDAEYREFFNDVNGDLILDDVSTLELRRAPDWIWSAGLDYSNDLGSGTVRASALFRYVDELFTCITPQRPAVLGNVVNDPRCLAEPREILDASIGYDFELGGSKLGITAFGRNLLDNRGLSSTLPVAGLFTFGASRPPRSYGVEVSFSF